MPSPGVDFPLTLSQSTDTGREAHARWPPETRQSPCVRHSSSLEQNGDLPFEGRDRGHAFQARSRGDHLKSYPPEVRGITAAFLTLPNIPDEVQEYQRHPPADFDASFRDAPDFLGSNALARLPVIGHGSEVHLPAELQEAPSAPVLEEERPCVARPPARLIGSPRPGSSGRKHPRRNIPDCSS